MSGNARSTIVAAAGPAGAGSTNVAGVTVIRLSGPDAFSIAAAVALPLPEAGMIWQGLWSIGQHAVPAKSLSFAAARSPSGENLVEIIVPGNAWLVDALLSVLHAAGAVPAKPGAFTRQALASGRLTLDQAEAVLQVAQAADAQQAAQAVGRLRGALAGELQPLRQQLLRLRMLVEAGLDFMDEDDVSAYNPQELQATLGEVHAVAERWQRAARSLSRAPIAALVGPANAGKSSLYRALTGAPVLVSPVAGTTRDWLRAPLPDGPSEAEIVDTAGWLTAVAAGPTEAIDEAAIEAGREQLAGAQVIVVCVAPDVSMPSTWRTSLPPGVPVVVVATKSDLGAPPSSNPAIADAILSLSVEENSGVDALRGVLIKHLGGGGDARQQGLLARAGVIASRLAVGALPGDDLLAEDLRDICDVLGDILGATTPDDVLDAIFAGFCIGK